MTQTTSTGPRPVQQQKYMPNQTETIDLLDLAQALWSKALYIIVAALLGGVLMLAYSVFLVTPKYTSTTTMYVNTGNLSLGSISATISTAELSTSEKLVDLYITILNSRETMDEVSQESGVNYDYEEMCKLVNAEAGDASGVFTVSVTDEDPNEAELIANTIAEVLPVRISDIVDGTSTRVIEYAVVAESHSSPSYTKNLAMGILVGAVLAMGILVVVYLRDTSADDMIHSVDDLKELYPDLPVLATILDMRLTEDKNYSYANYYSKDSGKDSKSKKKKKETTESSEEKMVTKSKESKDTKSSKENDEKGA